MQVKLVIREPVVPPIRLVQAVPAVLIIAAMLVGLMAAAVPPARHVIVPAVPDLVFAHLIAPAKIVGIRMDALADVQMAIVHFLIPVVAVGPPINAVVRPIARGAGRLTVAEAPVGAEIVRALEVVFLQAMDMRARKHSH